MKRRLGSSIREEEAITDEVPIVLEFAEIPTVGASLRPVLEILVDSVIPELPDEATLQSIGGMDRIPIFLERAIAIAHRMAVFAHDEWAIRLLRSRECNDGSDLRIHRTDDVRLRVTDSPIAADRSFVMEWARSIEGTKVGGSSIMIEARTGFVTE